MPQQHPGCNFPPAFASEWLMHPEFDPPQAEAPRNSAPGDPCPACEKGRLDYNGLFQLECSLCGHKDVKSMECGCAFQADAV